LQAGHAYLPDGTPLTEYDEYGRIVPASAALSAIEKTCAGGHLSLADRQRGIEALARALDEDDLVKAPLLLLHLQIDPKPSFAKFNPFHKPPGDGGGQFTSGPAGSALEPVASSMRVNFTTDYTFGVYGDDVDIAHKLIMALVALSILEVGQKNFRPGMPGYGIELHNVLAAKINALHHPGLYANPIYLGGLPIEGKGIPAGASVPDIVYAPKGQVRAAWEVKTGSAADTSSSAVTTQRERALGNLPDGVPYSYILITEN
jgi:hypothetical protein